MSFLGGSSAPTGASQTQAIKQQVAQEAAVANARQLVEVNHQSQLFSLSLPSPIYMLITCATETQRTLLRALHPQTRFFAVLGRIHLLLSVHGKVHVCMERRIQAIHQPHTERSWFWRPHDVNSTLQFSRHYTRPHITRKRRREREKERTNCMI
jgi:hypothetical protein